MTIKHISLMKSVVRHLIALAYIAVISSCSTVTDSNPKTLDADVTTAKAFWKDTPSHTIPEDTKACFDIKTRRMKYVYGNVNKPASSEEELRQRYRVLARIISLEPDCKGKYDAEHLSLSELMDRKLVDEDKLPPAEKERIDRDFAQAYQERDSINLEADASIKSPEFIKAMVECTFPEKTYLFSILYPADFFGIQTPQGLTPSNLDRNLTVEYTLKTPQQFFGMDSRAIYTSTALPDKFWGIQINKDTDIERLATKMGLTKRSLNKQETSDSEAIGEGLSADVPGIKETYLYSKTVNDGWGEIQLTQMRASNLFYKPNPPESAEQWYLGCVTREPGLPLDPDRRKALANSVDDAVKTLDRYIDGHKER